MSLNQLKIFKRYRFFKQSQYWDRQTIKRYQLQCVRDILLHAGQNVPYYRDLFKSIRFNPEKFSSLQDLEKIPLLDRTVIQKNPERLICDSAKTHKGSWQNTSGSTGTPIRIFIDENSKINKTAATLRVYNWAGYFPGKRALVIQDYTGKSDKEFGYRPSSNSLFFHAPSISRESILKFHKLLKLVKPKYYIGYGRSFLYIYKHLVELNLHIPSPKSLINYGENINLADKMNLKNYYNTRFYDYYCNSENVVMAADIRPEEMFLMEDYFYPEVINEYGQLVEDGVGELVGTGFYNFAMPMIRYRTGDLIELKKSFHAKYTHFTPVKQINGRIQDKILLPDGREIYFLGSPMWQVPGIHSSQYIQEEIDKLQLNLLTDDAFSLDSIDPIREKILKKLGGQITVDIRVVDRLEYKGSGKIPSIISRID